MMPDDAFPDVRRHLDEAPVPAVRPVDLPALYAAATLSETRRARRWQLAAGAAAAIAAAVLVAVLLPRLEIRAGNGEFAIRWGPPQRSDSVSNQFEARFAALEADLRLKDAKLAQLESRTTRLDDLAAAQKELQDLLLVVAVDVAKIDATQKGTGEQHDKFLNWTSTRFREMDDKFTAVHKDQSAMYALVTDCRK